MPPNIGGASPRISDVGIAETLVWAGGDPGMRKQLFRKSQTSSFDFGVLGA
jgi:hypothetical protein